MIVIKWFCGWSAGLIAFLALDAFWLGFAARDFYQSRLGSVIDMHVRYPVAGVFYALHLVGVMYFVVMPSAQSDLGLWHVLFRGALYGLFTYATYDLTNLATVRGWPVSLALVDIGWGMVLNAVVAMVAMAVVSRF